MARETINGISVPIPGTGEPADFQGDLRRMATDISATIVSKVGNAATVLPTLFSVNDGTGREVGDSILIDPTAGSDNDQLAHWQIKQAGRGRLFHFTSTDAIGASGVRDYIGMGVGYGGNGLLVSVKDDGAGRPGNGINTALQANAVAGSRALAVGQYNTVSPAASFNAYSATHKPVVEFVGIESAAGQQLFRVQVVQAGVYTTTEYIDSQTGKHVFGVAPDLLGATVRTTLDFSAQTVDQPRVRAKEISGQTANFLEVLNLAGSAYLFNVTSAGRVLAPRLALNTAGATGGATLSVNGEGAALANSIFRAHASAPGDLAQFTDSASVVYSRVSKNGYYMTRKATAPLLADMTDGDTAIWRDPTTGDLKVTSRVSGALKSATVVVA